MSIDIMNRTGLSDGVPLDGVLQAQHADLAARERELLKAMHEACRRHQQAAAMFERQIMYTQEAQAVAADWKRQCEREHRVNLILVDRLQVAITRVRELEARLAEAGAWPPALATATGRADPCAAPANATAPSAAGGTSSASAISGFG